MDNYFYSFIVPCFNEENNIKTLISRVTHVLESMGAEKYEIIFINDGSTDNSLSILKCLAIENNHLVIIDLSRNFGKEAALTAGLLNAKGDVAIPLDADLQDPPELIPEMIEVYRNNDVDAVLCQRIDRKSDSFSKSLTAKIFYFVHNLFSNPKIPSNVGDFRLINRQILDTLKLYPETCRFMKGIFADLGFRCAYITYKRPRRNSGRTKFSFWKLWNFALDGITSYSTFPLRIWTYLGLVVAFFALIYFIFILIVYIFHGIDVPGYSSIILLILFFGALQLINLGLIGEYLGRTYMETKRRPIYIIRKIYRS